jgi:hypothetical protein
MAAHCWKHTPSRIVVAVSQPCLERVSKRLQDLGVLQHTGVLGDFEVAIRYEHLSARRNAVPCTPVINGSSSCL